MNKLQIVEHKELRILTTAQLAEGYGTESQVIVNNYNRNKERYTEGTHFFKLEGESKRNFIDLNQIELGSKNAQYLYLWTEKGAFLHAKSLNTDQAWQVYEMLVDSYFQKQLTKPQTLEDLIIMQAQSVKELKNKVNLLEENVMKTADKTEMLEKRFNNMLDIDITQPKKDILGQYVKRYAIKHLKSNFSQAWKDFNNAFYYATNLKVKVRADNANQSVPVWLDSNGYIDTAIRVADAMLNKGET